MARESNVYGLPSQLGARPPAGDGGDVDTRLTRLETRLDTLLPLLATKGDVSEAKADIIKWTAGLITAAVAIIISVLAFMLNRAVPPQAQTQPAPIIVYPVQQFPAQPASGVSPDTKRTH